MRFGLVGLLLVAAPLVAQSGLLVAPPPPPPLEVQISRLEAQLNDFGGLNRYRAEDAALPAAGPGVQRVVFFGDSITDAWGRRKDTGEFFPGKPYVNRGISGQTTPQMLIRFRQDVIDLHPAAVVILAGTNDIAQNTGPESMETIHGNFHSMVDLAQAAHIRVVLASVLPADRFPWHPRLAPAGQIRELNTWLASFARERGLVYLNYYPALATPEGAMIPELAGDRAVHPNTAGYAKMQPLAEAAVAKALATPVP